MSFNFLFDLNSTVLTMQVVFAVCVLFISCFFANNILIYRFFTLAISFIPLFWSLAFWFLYDSTGQQFQMVCYLSRLHLSFGLDAVGLSLVVLTAALFPLCIALMRTYTGILCFLLLEIVILGSLTVLDLLGFYILFEASLILLFLLIARTPYGSIDAAYYIVLYTMAGSLVLLPVIFLIYSEQGSTNLLALIVQTESPVDAHSCARQLLLGWGMLAVFAVKIPLMPVHLWLPAAHVAASLSGSMLLAGVLLKLGLLGIIRFMIPIVPAFVTYVSPFVITLCLVSYVVALFSTIRQVDLKKVIAYSSISHMATMTLAAFSMGEFSSFAGTYYMIAHGLVSPTLFFLVGVIYERGHTRNIHYFSGIGSYMPVYSFFFFYMILANCSFPFTPGFVSEVLCLASIFSLHSLLAFIICLGQVLTAVYNFWLFNRICHGNLLTRLQFDPSRAPIIRLGASGGVATRKGADADADLMPYSKNWSATMPCSMNRTAGPSCSKNRTALIAKKANFASVDLTRFEFAVLVPLTLGCLWLGIKPMF
jgi:proton-translocating NADH-quinone oxidoreductase chain M